MQVNMKGTKLALTPAIKAYIQMKMDMLDKFLGEIQVIGANYEVEKTTRHHTKGEIYRAEANLIVPHETLRVEKTEKDLYKAIDKVKDHLIRSIKRHKEKLIDKKRQGKPD
jgi:putative sigma-54 modulation protein